MRPTTPDAMCADLAPVSGIARPRRGIALLALAALALAGGVGAVARGAGQDSRDLPVPDVRPAAVVVGGDTPWIASGPTDRAALRRGWSLALDPSDAGVSHGWAAGAFAGRPVTVPYAPNGAEVTGAAGMRSFRGTIAWYRRDVHVRRSGLYVLRFESVSHHATIWVDGRKVGSHVGAYLPFELRVPLSPSRVHRIVVRADWRNPSGMKADGWHRTWFNFGGIDREVTLRRVGPSELTAPTVRTQVRGRTALVDVGVTVRNTGRHTRPIAVRGELRHGGQRLPFSLGSVWVAPGDARVLRARVPVRGAALWGPGHPALYDLALVSGAHEAGWRTQVGLREISARGGHLTLNGKPLRLRGASLQEDVPGRGDALRPRDQDALVRDLRRLGANATRAQHPLDEALLERLDRAGILVWLGVGPIDSPGDWTSTTPRLARLARARVMSSVHVAQPHPSVLAWNLANEVSGNGHDAGQVAYVQRMARELHGRDPGRLVALDVWGAHPPTSAGPIYRDVDAVGVTNYLGWYEDTYASTPALTAAVRSHIDALRQTFAGKVMVVTEFGAEGNSRNPAGAPGSLGFQARVLRTHLGVYRRTPGLDGELVWSLRDFAVTPAFAGGSINKIVPDIRLVKGINQKGLLTYGGRWKPAARVVRAAFAR
jgi:hypothetical protein